jgi:hypothetical protein
MPHAAAPERIEDELDIMQEYASSFEHDVALKSGAEVGCHVHGEVCAGNHESLLDHGNHIEPGNAESNCGLHEGACSGNHPENLLDHGDHDHHHSHGPETACSVHGTHCSGDHDALLDHGKEAGALIKRSSSPETSCQMHGNACTGNHEALLDHGDHDHHHSHGPETACSVHGTHCSGDHDALLDHGNQGKNQEIVLHKENEIPIRPDNMHEDIYKQIEQNITITETAAELQSETEEMSEADLVQAAQTPGNETRIYEREIREVIEYSNAQAEDQVATNEIIQSNHMHESNDDLDDLQQESGPEPNSASGFSLAETERPGTDVLLEDVAYDAIVAPELIEDTEEDAYTEEQDGLFGFNVQDTDSSHIKFEDSSESKNLEESDNDRFMGVNEETEENDIQRQTDTTDIISADLETVMPVAYESNRFQIFLEHFEESEATQIKTGDDLDFEVAPLENVLARLQSELISASSEQDSQYLTTVRTNLREAIHEIQNAEKPPFNDSAEISPELQNRIFDILRLIGYQNPEAAFEDFMSRHDLEFLSQALHYLSQLANEDNRQEFLIQSNSRQLLPVQPTFLRVGKTVMRLVKAGFEKPGLNPV